MMLNITIQLKNSRKGKFQYLTYNHKEDKFYRDWEKGTLLRGGFEASKLVKKLNSKYPNNKVFSEQL